MTFEPNPFLQFTTIPNLFLDEMMRELGCLEIKIALYVMRQTYGWHKEKDRISLSRFEEALGCSRSHLNEAIKKLVEKKIIEREVFGRPGFQVTYYKLCVKKEEKSKPPNKPENNFSEGCPTGTGGGAQRAPTKETLTKENKQANNTRACAGETEPPSGERLLACSSRNLNFSSKDECQQNNHPIQKPNAPTPPPAPRVDLRKGKIHPDLEPLEMPDYDKSWISARYDDVTIRNAVLTFKNRKDIECVPAFIKRACEAKYKPSSTTTVDIDANKAYAKQFDGLSRDGMNVDVLNKQVEFVYTRSQQAPVCVPYDKRDFKKKIDELVQKFKLKT